MLFCLVMVHTVDSAVDVLQESGSHSLAVSLPQMFLQVLRRFLSLKECQAVPVAYFLTWNMLSC